MEMLERQNMELLQRLRKEQDILEEQENTFKKQLEEVNTEHTNNLMKMGFLLANQKNVTYIIFINPILHFKIVFILIINAHCCRIISVVAN